LSRLINGFSGFPCSGSFVSPSQLKYNMYRTKYKQKSTNPFYKKARLGGLIICFLLVKMAFLATLKLIKRAKK
jgi:hypothetical protein